MYLTKATCHGNLMKGPRFPKKSSFMLRQHENEWLYRDMIGQRDLELMETDQERENLHVLTSQILHTFTVCISNSFILDREEDPSERRVYRTSLRQISEFPYGHLPCWVVEKGTWRMKNLDFYDLFWGRKLESGRSLERALIFESSCGTFRSPFIQCSWQSTMLWITAFWASLSASQCQCVTAIVTKHHRMGGLSNRNVFS